jgi:hypothetical protein
MERKNRQRKIQGSLHYAIDDKTVYCSGRDDVTLYEDNGMKKPGLVSGLSLVR